MLSTEILKEYIATFYGYGNWVTSKFWFIGIEEGGGNKIENVEKRLESWELLGKHDLIDCYDHHWKMNSYTEQSIKKPHSRTWTRLILTKLSFQSKNTNTADVLNLQLTDWGNLLSDNLLIELFPLPSPGVKDWFYPDWVDLTSDLSFLKCRDSYKETVVSNRVKNIKAKVEQHKPSVVLFYGKSQQDHWNDIIGTTDLKMITLSGHTIRHIYSNKTLFIQCPQPSYIRGYAFWKDLGIKIQQLLEISTNY